jgi:hypothetical protein
VRTSVTVPALSPRKDDAAADAEVVRLFEAEFRRLLGQSLRALSLGAVWGAFWFVFGALLAVLTGCSALVGPESDPVLYCHATKEPVQCPTDPEAARRAVRVFSENVMFLSQDEPLVIHWYDWDEEFGKHPGDVVGYAQTDRFPQEVHVRSTGVLMHELAHVALDREADDPDANHEEPPGPWGPALNAAIERAAKAYGVTNPVERE